jgi:hypothetical protein
MATIGQLGAEKYVLLTTFRRDGLIGRLSLLGSKLRRGDDGTVTALVS